MHVGLRLALLFVGLLSASCGTTLVPVTLGVAPTPTNDPSSKFEIVTRTSSVKDPLPVTGTDVAFASLEPAFAQALAANVPARNGYELTVELTSAEADYNGSRLRIALVARATLREREGNAFVAQLSTICRDSALVRPNAGGRVVFGCMRRLARDVTGWLDGLPP
jgi:hypothetical protein